MTVFFNYTVTTGVQSTSLCQLNETSFSVMCIFLTGSRARGCVYTLVSTSEERVTGCVGRGNSSEGVQWCRRRGGGNCPPTFESGGGGRHSPPPLLDVIAP